MITRRKSRGTSTAPAGAEVCVSVVMGVGPFDTIVFCREGARVESREKPHHPASTLCLANLSVCPPLVVGRKSNQRFASLSRVIALNCCGASAQNNWGRKRRHSARR